MDISDSGIFVISLDFELYWGVSESRSLESYKENLKNVPYIINEILSLFEVNNIHATWATVGFLFHDTKEEMGSLVLPIDRPVYLNRNLDNYNLINSIGENEREDSFHFALSIIKKIKNYPYQEIATHTYSHYYCLENGQDYKKFSIDLGAAITIAKKNGIKFSSIVFPRNQYDEKVIEICKNNGINSYRGTENHWIYRTRNRADETQIRRLLRFIDAYYNITGKKSYKIKKCDNDLLNIPSSRFLRPFSTSLSFFEPMRLKLIKREMTLAAMNNEIYHLWWHPHNFGININENLKFLKEILDHFCYLNSTKNMISLNMKEISEWKQVK